jgi:hypothetical protein
VPNLKVTITNESGAVTGEYVIGCLDRPGLDSEQYDTAYTINLIRAAAERHLYLADFPPVHALSQMSPTFYLNDAVKTAHMQNVNELWLEIENLLLGARLNFATARIFKDLEDSHTHQTHFDLNARLDLHLEKMERFHLGVFELVRIEDMIVRLLYEYFGDGFIETDVTRPGWEKRLTWDAMKDALNSRGQPDKDPHPALEAMDEREYQTLMAIVRSYRSAEVLRLVRYRDTRTHRITPSVDHPELAVDIVSPPQDGTGIPTMLFNRRNAPEHSFLDLYADTKQVYSQLSALLHRLNAIIHA